MIELSNRCLAIVEMLLKQDGYIRSLDIAENFNVSVRTVKYDIDKIRWWMKDNDLQLLTSPKKGYSISKDDKEAIEELLNSNGNGYFYSSPERLNNLIYFLLAEYNGEKIDEIAAIFDVSKNTILRDLDKAQEWFISHGVSINRKQKKGIELRFSENEVRRLLVDNIIENENVDDIIKCYALNKTLKMSNNAYLKLERKIYESDNVNFVISFLEDFVEKNNYHVSDVNMIYLIYFLCIQLLRIKDGHYIASNYVLFSKDYEEIFEKLCANDKLVTYLSLPTIRATFELKYMAKILYAYIDKADISLDNSDLTQDVYNYLVQRIYEITHCDISKDIEVAKAMKLHISSMINRLNMKLPYQNLMLNDIKTKYADSYKLADEIFDELEDKYQINKYDDEIGFIALYISQALNRIFKDAGNYHYVNTLLICSQGQARVTYLVKSLQERFNRIKIVNKISVFKLKDFDFSNIDLILTTIDIPFTVLKPVIKVNPILSKRNIEKIEMFLSENMGSSYSGGNKELLLNEIINTIGQYYDVETNFKLKEDLRILIGSDNKPLPNLPQVLKEEYISALIDAYDWEDAVVQASEPLLKAGAIDGRYLEEIFMLKNRDGQYAMVTSGICLPHASPSSNNRLSLSLATLKEPIEIPIDDTKTKIKVIMVLAINDNIRYSKAVDELFTLFATYEDFADRLVQGKTRKEIVEILKACYDRVDW